MKKNILMLGGTGFFGIYTVAQLLNKGHKVTIATRGKNANPFEGSTQHIKLDRTNPESIASTLYSLPDFDVVIDNLVFCSNDVKYLLDVIKPKRYVYTSTIAVYDEDLQMDMLESHFDPLSPGLVWCDREELPYGECKRQAERALFQVYNYIPATALRIPYVIGTDDYTERLFFYVDSVVNERPMYINNLDQRLSFITSKDAGMFLAWAALADFTGPINGANGSDFSLAEIISYVEEKTGKKAIHNQDAEAGKYNGRWSFSTSVERAASLGFSFSDITKELHNLLDEYISLAYMNGRK